MLTHTRPSAHLTWNKLNAAGGRGVIFDNAIRDAESQTTKQHTMPHYA